MTAVPDPWAEVVRQHAPMIRLAHQLAPMFESFRQLTATPILEGVHQFYRSPAFALVRDGALAFNAAVLELPRLPAFLPAVDTDRFFHDPRARATQWLPLWIDPAEYDEVPTLRWRSHQPRGPREKIDWVPFCAEIFRLRTENQLDKFDFPDVTTMLEWASEFYRQPPSRASIYAKLQQLQRASQVWSPNIVSLSLSASQRLSIAARMIALAGRPVGTVPSLAWFKAEIRKFAQYEMALRVSIDVLDRLVERIYGGEGTRRQQPAHKRS